MNIRQLVLACALSIASLPIVARAAPVGYASNEGAGTVSVIGPSD